MDITGKLAGRPFGYRVSDAYSMGDVIGLVFDALKRLASDRGMDVRADLEVHIADAIVDQANLFPEVRVGEVTAEPPSIFGRRKEALRGA